MRCPRLRTALVAIGVTLVSPIAAPRHAAEAAPPVAGATARSHLQAGARAGRAARWDEALTEYRAAMEASPSAAAASGVAEALDALRENVRAYDAYRTLLAGYEKQLAPALLATARARLAALERVTGALDVRVTAAGAHVTVDGAAVGDTPLTGPVRVATGLHRVRATKAGFEDAEALPTVDGGGTVVVELAPKQTAKTGHVVVRAERGAPATLVVDGQERGPLPWDGELEAGPHDLFARSATLASTHRSVDVARGETVNVELRVDVIQSAVSVATVDRRGSLAIDGKAAGEGTFEGRLAVGPHTLRITRTGYEPIDRVFTLREGESFAETFTMTPAGSKAAASARPFEGVVGGVMLAGSFQVNSLNGDFSEPCSFASSPSPSGCSAGSPVGGAVMGYVGYTANPVGVDVLFGAQLDSTTASLSVPGGKQPTESYTVPRVGAFLAPRARISGQTAGFRFSFAAGVGLALRSVALSGHGVSGAFGGDPSGLYVAPAITLEGAAHVRLTETLGLGLGVMYWAESAGNGVSLKSGSVLTQPAVVLSATQAMVLPFVALEVGP
jgi:hypothetical protein